MSHIGHMLLIQGQNKQSMILKVFVPAFKSGWNCTGGFAIEALSLFVFSGSRQRFGLVIALHVSLAPYQVSLSSALHRQHCIKCTRIVESLVDIVTADIHLIFIVSSTSCQLCGCTTASCVRKIPY